MPAFPIILPENNLKGYPEQYIPGLTKREWMAAMAMKGLLGCDMVGNAGNDGKQIALMSINYADALIAELSKPQP